MQASAGENLNPFLGPDVTEPVSKFTIFSYFRCQEKQDKHTFMGISNQVLIHADLNFSGS